MRETGRTVEVNSSRAVRKVSLMVLQTLATGTPVDTGRARSNWLVSLGTPVDLTVDAHAPAPGRDGHGGGEGRPGSTGAENTRVAITRGGQVIGTYGPGGGSVWISNNLPYIKRLNDGWSGQAPAGFVEQAISAAREAARRQNLLS